MRSLFVLAALLGSTVVDAAPSRLRFVGNQAVAQAALDALAPADGNLSDRALDLVSLKTSLIYWDLGYVDVKVVVTDGTCVIGALTPDCRRSSVATIRIDEGAAFSIGAVEFRGFPTAVRDLVRVRAGDVFSRTTVVKDREHLQASFGAPVMPLTKRHEHLHTIDIVFELGSDLP